MPERTTTGSPRVSPLIAVETAVAVSVVYGEVGSIWHNIIGMPDDWLEGTMFTSWIMPGAYLFLVVALPMGVAVVAEMTTSPGLKVGRRCI